MTANDPAPDAAPRKNRLSVVCTPIGNLGDLSPRASEVLKGADLILCEDTRHSKPLLDRIGAHGRLLSCHQHNERERATMVAQELLQGKKVALVSDAGAPGVSDPGGRLIESVIGLGAEIEVLPGPSALTAAVMGAGIDVSRFMYLGFLPRSGKVRTDLIALAAKSGLGVVIYEAPNRVEETLADLQAELGVRRVVVARELTKLHETFHRGVLGGPLAPPFFDKGEAVIVVEGGEARPDVGIDVDAVAQDLSLSPKERAKRIAGALGIPVKDAYDRVQRANLHAGDRLARARTLLAEAAHALADADLAARRERGEPPPTDEKPPVLSDIPGADVLLAMLARPSAMRAPVETAETARAFLGALSAIDMLEEALLMEESSRIDDEEEKKSGG